jgi:hypothetical protein
MANQNGTKIEDIFQKVQDNIFFKNNFLGKDDGMHPKPVSKSPKFNLANIHNADLQNYPTSKSPVLFDRD